MSDVKDELVKILLTPIVCTERSKGIPQIRRNDSIIESTQTYDGILDPDMSDFTTGFYEIIYKKIINENHIVDNSGIIKDCCFAGDTMNSFNSIANITPGAGKSKNLRTPIDQWPCELKNYHRIYHSLANFWILPMCIGRRSMKLNRYDSMDIFLKKVKLIMKAYLNSTIHTILTLQI